MPHSTFYHGPVHTNMSCNVCTFMVYKKNLLLYEIVEA